MSWSRSTLLFRFLTRYINLPENETIHILDPFLVNHFLGIQELRFASIKLYDFLLESNQLQRTNLRILLCALYLTNFCILCILIPFREISRKNGFI
jgi:hypothetical protein